MKILRIKTIARRLSVLALTVCVLGVFAPTDVLAQDASKAEQAQQAFDDGMSFYTEKEYGKAVAEFRKGYALMPAGMFLYNITLSYIKLGEYAKAQRYAQRAAEQGDLPKKTLVKNAARIDALTVRISAAKLADSLEPEAQSDLFGSQKPKDPSGETPKESGGPGMMTYAGAGTALVGVGLIGGALYMGSDIEARSDQLAQVDDRADYDTMRSSIESDRSVGQVLLVSGIGLAAVGSGLVVWDLMGSDESSGELSVQPLVGATTGARVQWQW
jgi:tetratricopeptide (TPR) repeat protein